MLEKEITTYKQSLPLLITKLSLIRDNDNTSIEKRKQQIQARERKIKLHEQQQQQLRMTMHCSSNHKYKYKGIIRSLSTNCILNDHNMSNSNSNNNNISKTPHNNNNIKHNKDILLNKPISKIDSYMNKSNYKINFRKSQSLNDKSNILSSHSNSDIKLQNSFKMLSLSKTPKNINHNNNKRASLFNITLNNFKKHDIIIPSSKQYIHKNVYGISNELLDKLKKIQLNKKDLNLKNYHESLIALGKDILTKDNIKKLCKTFTKIRKDTDIKIIHTKRYIKWLEHKEEKIIDNINHYGLRAMFLFKAFNTKSSSKALRHIRFDPVMN